MCLLRVAKRWSHHTPSGGYDRLMDVMPGFRITRQSNSRFSDLLRRTIDRRRHAPDTLVDYQHADLQVERMTIFRTWSTHIDIVHSLYGDEQLNHLLHRRHWLRSKLVASFHLPWFRCERRFISQRSLLLDGVNHFVAVSSDLAQIMSDFLGTTRVTYVPHGIDTAAFSPALGPRRDGPLRLLTVGSHMRDLDLVHRICDHARYHSLPIEFSYIGQKDSFRDFIGCGNLRKKSGLSERELIAAYHDCDALLLPLTGATANNSLLESLSCSKPVISTLIGGVPDYLDEECGWLLPRNDFDALLELILVLAADPEACTQKSEAARKKAESFSWERIAEQMVTVYQRTIES
jgi:glycosyltransferase involved in cell wall biosynthesis